MGRARHDRKGPVLVITRHRERLARMRDLLEADRFEVLEAPSPADGEAQAAARRPTAIVIDWDADGDPPRQEAVHRLRPRASGARLVVIADGAEARALEGSLVVRAVVAPSLDADEFIDAVWGAHQETIDSRAGRAR